MNEIKNEKRKKEWMQGRYEEERKGKGRKKGRVEKNGRKD